MHWDGIIKPYKILSILNPPLKNILKNTIRYWRSLSKLGNISLASRYVFLSKHMKFPSFHHPLPYSVALGGFKWWMGDIQCLTHPHPVKHTMIDVKEETILSLIQSIATAAQGHFSMRTIHQKWHYIKTSHDVLGYFWWTTTTTKMLP